ncbi:MAG: hypothetical protein GYA21_09050 [Myxococcales bacterium]|nr:hypothetical protein [Myxococcales bacterium]
MPVPGFDPTPDRPNAGGQHHRSARLLLLALVLLSADPAWAGRPEVDLWVWGQDQWAPGEEAWLRIVVRLSTSLSQSAPLPLAAIEVELAGPNGAHKLLSARSDLLGTLEARLHVPDEPEGEYTVAVRCRTPFGDRSLTRPVRLVRTVRALATSDKRAYRPGQPIRVRTVLLDGATGSPRANQALEVALRDAHGVEIQRQDVATDEAGVALATFEPLPAAAAGLLRARVRVPGPGMLVPEIPLWLLPATAPTGAPGDDPPPPAAPPAGGFTLEIEPEGERLVAGVENRLLLRLLGPRGQPARASLRLVRPEREMGPAVIGADGRGEIRVLVPVDELASGAAPYPAVAASGRFAVPEAARREPPRVWTARAEAVLPSGESVHRELLFPVQPEHDRLLLRLGKSRLRQGDAVEVSVLSPEDGACFLEIFREGQALDGRALPIVRGRGEFRFTPDRAGRYWIQAWRLYPDGGQNHHTLPLSVVADGALKIDIARDRARYQPGQEARLRILTTDEGGRPIRAVLGWTILHEALDPDASPATPRAFDPLASMDEPSHPPLLSLWQNPFEQRKLSAEDDRRAIQSALYRRLERSLPLGERGPDGRWRYFPDLFAELGRDNSLPEAHRLDPFGEPYAPQTVGELWPELSAGAFLPSQDLNRLLGLRATLVARLVEQIAREPKLSEPLGERLRRELAAIVGSDAGAEYLHSVSGEPYSLDWIEEAFAPEELARDVHAPRAQAVFLALAQYLAESERWYRSSACPASGACRLPADVLDRLLMRGLLEADQARDAWGRPFRIQPDPAGRPFPAQPRLGGIALLSDGEDGVAGTTDDVRLDPFPLDGGLRSLSRRLGLVDPAPAAPPGNGAAAAPTTAISPDDAPAEADAEVVEYTAENLVDERGAEIRVRLPEQRARVRMIFLAHDGRGLYAAAVHYIDIDAPVRAER